MVFIKCCFRFVFQFSWIIVRLLLSFYHDKMIIQKSLKTGKTKFILPESYDDNFMGECLEKLFGKNILLPNTQEDDEKERENVRCSFALMA